MSAIEKPFRTGKTAARKAQKEQASMIAKQRQIDELALAEEEDLIARKKSMAKSGTGGRASLIKTSESGVKSTNLAGTV